MSTKRAAAKDTPFKRAFLYRGIFTRVAKRIGVSRSHVRRVAAGERYSERVSIALTEEIRRIEKEAA
jgi:hypothetical protein